MVKEFHVRAAMIDRVAFVTHNADSPFIESECRMSEVSGQNLDTTLVPARRKLSLVERLPQTGLGRAPVSLICDGRKMSRDRSGVPSESPSRSSIAARSLTTGVV